MQHNKNLFKSMRKLLNNMNNISLFHTMRQRGKSFGLYNYRCLSLSLEHNIHPSIYTFTERTYKQNRIFFLSLAFSMMQLNGLSVQKLKIKKLKCTILIEAFGKLSVELTNNIELQQQKIPKTKNKIENLKQKS